MILFIVLSSVASYLVIGMLVGRPVARWVYVHDRERWESLSWGNPRYGLFAAVMSLIGVTLFWPPFLVGWIAYHVTRVGYQLTGTSFIPEYRVERNKQIERELDQKIRDQQREIERLAWEIKRKS